MSATETKTVSVDRELLLELIQKVDGLATFDTLQNGGEETFLTERIYRIIEPLEREVFGPMTDEQAQAQHDRGVEYGREMFREMVKDVLGDA